MGSPLDGIGVLFDIDGLGGGLYGLAAYKILMTHCDPVNLAGCLFRDGDTNRTLHQREREFCLGVYGGPQQIGYLRDVFKRLEVPGLGYKGRRFLEKPDLDREPLVDTGRVDRWGRFVTKEWTRMDHDLCKGARWGFAPESVTVDVSPELRSELDMLKKLPERSIEEELITPENVSKELLKSIFDAAFMDVSYDKDGDILINERVLCYVFPHPEQRRIRLHVQYGCKPEASDPQKLECANLINRDYVIVRAAVTTNGKLLFTHDVNLDGGISKKAFVLLAKRFCSIPPQAVNEYGGDVVK